MTSGGSSGVHTRQRHVDLAGGRLRVFISFRDVWFSCGFFLPQFLSYVSTLAAHTKLVIGIPS